MNMRRMMIWLLVLLLVPGVMQASDINREMLEAAEGITVFLDDNDVDTVYRTGTQPFFGNVDGDGRSICAYLDLVEFPDLDDCVVPRLMLCLETDEEVHADEVIVQAGSHTYVFSSPDFSINEYDMTFYEDYVLLLAGNGSGLLKDLAGLGAKPLRFSLGGDVSGEIEGISETGKILADLYRKAGGEKQNLEKVAEAHPVEMRKQ